MDKCKTCKFFDQTSSGNLNQKQQLEDGIGRCVRYPPSVYIHDDSPLFPDEEPIEWYCPAVYDDQWCGEWVQK